MVMRRDPEAALRRLERRWWLIFAVSRLLVAPRWFMPVGAFLAAVAGLVWVGR